MVDGSAMPTRRFVLVALAAGALVGVGLSYPLVLHPASTVVDDGTNDAFQFVWNVWWVREALVALQTNPFYTRHLFHPDGVSLLFHTFSPSLGLASVPLQLVLPGGALTAHNVLVIAAPALIVCMTALLAREVTGDPWAALGGGLVAALNVAMTWFLPIIYLTSTYLVAAVLWAWWRLHRRRRGRDVALVVALLVALLFASQEYALMAALLLALDAAARVLAPRPLGLRPAWVGGGLAAGALAAGVFLAVALVAAGSPPRELRATAVANGSGFLLGFVRPPWLGPEDLFPFWYILYLGTAPLALVAATAWLGRGRAAFWALALGFVLLMACGPEVGLYHPLIGGPPGTEALAAVRVPGPYALVAAVFPLLRFVRAVYRWVSVGHVVLGVLVAVGLAGLRARLPAAARAPATAACLAAIVGLGILDVHAFRKPVVAAEIPAALAVVRDDPEPAAVLELPVGLAASGYVNLSSRYMFHQTAHRKYLLEGTVSRFPQGVVPLIGRRFGSFAEVPWVKWVVLHRDRLADAFPATREQVAHVEGLLAAEGALVHRDGPVEVYRVRTFRPETVRPAG